MFKYDRTCANFRSLFVCLMSDVEEFIKSHVSKCSKTEMYVELVEDISKDLQKKILEQKCYMRPQKMNAKRSFVLFTKELSSIPLDVFKILFNADVTQEFFDSLIEASIEKSKEAPKPVQKPAPQPEKPQKQDNFRIDPQRNDQNDSRRGDNYSRSNHNYNDDYEAAAAPPPPPPPNKRRDAPLFNIPGHQQYDDYQRPKRNEQRGGYRSAFYDNGGDEDDDVQRGYRGQNSYDNYKHYGQYNRRYNGRNESSRFYDNGEDDDEDDYNARPPPQKNYNNAKQEQPRRERPNQPRGNKHETHLTLDDFPALGDFAAAPPAKPSAWGEKQEQVVEEQQQNGVEVEPSTQSNEESAKVEAPKVSDAWTAVANEDQSPEEVAPTEDEFWVTKKEASKVYGKFENNILKLGGNNYYIAKAKKELASWYATYIKPNLAEDGTPDFGDIDAEDEDDMIDVFKALKRIEFK